MEILTSKTELSYPLYACDFDAQDSGRLLVGGGGGSSRTGVSNSITVLRTPAVSDPSLQTVATIELSKDEDNVTSLAAGPRRKTTTIAYAGVNSSPADQKAGKNEHFRVFGVDSADGAEKTASSITELTRAAFFAPPKTTGRPDDTYQRLVRVSAPLPDGQGGLLPQLGACATGLAQAGTAQVVLFDVTSDGPVLPHVRGRIEELPDDVTDLDVIQTGVDAFQLVFCTGHEVFLYNVSTKSDEKPVRVHAIAGSATERPSFRAIRYLSPNFVLAALNLPKRTGVLLQGLRLPSLEKGKPETNMRMGVHVRVPRSVLTQATALAVRSLAPPTAPGTRLGDTQFVVAVAGAPDNTVALYTLEHQTEGSVAALAKLYPFRTLRQVHELQMTSVALSPLPTTDVTDTSPYLHLASVSVKNTVVVHHIPLRALAPSDKTATTSPSRYVVAIPSRAPSSKSLYIFVAVMMVVVSLLAQGLLEVLAATTPVLGARAVVPASWLRPLPSIQTAPVAVVPSSTPAAAVPVGNNADSLAELLRGSGGESDDGGAPKVLFIRGEDAGQTIEVATHDEAEHGPAVAWTGLSPEQQAAWRQGLQDAGYWGEEMGEAVFRGILFGEMGGLVRGIVN